MLGNGCALLQVTPGPARTPHALRCGTCVAVQGREPLASRRSELGQRLAGRNDRDRVQLRQRALRGRVELRAANRSRRRTAPCGPAGPMRREDVDDAAAAAVGARLLDDFHRLVAVTRTSGPAGLQVDGLPDAQGTHAEQELARAAASCAAGRGWTRRRRWAAVALRLPLNTASEERSAARAASRPPTACARAAARPAPGSGTGLRAGRPDADLLVHLPGVGRLRGDHQHGPVQRALQGSGHAGRAARSSPRSMGSAVAPAGHR